MSAAAIQAVAAIVSPEALTQSLTVNPAATAATATPNATSFTQVLMSGIESVNQRVASADAMVRAFAVDDSIPLHQVTFALEEARLSVEMMMQVRARLVESYQRMMEMQL